MTHVGRDSCTWAESWFKVERWVIQVQCSAFPETLGSRYSGVICVTGLVLCEAGRALYGNVRWNALGFAKYPGFRFAKYSRGSDDMARELLDTEWNVYP